MQLAYYISIRSTMGTDMLGYYPAPPSGEKDHWELCLQPISLLTGSHFCWLLPTYQRKSPEYLFIFPDHIRWLLLYIN